MIRKIARIKTFGNGPTDVSVDGIRIVLLFFHDVCIQWLKGSAHFQMKFEWQSSVKLWSALSNCTHYTQPCVQTE